MRIRLPGRRDLVTFGCVFALLAAVTLLPPDTSLREIRAGGVLRACVPEHYQPLITDDPARPGLDIELLKALAAALNLRLDLVVNPMMGRDFNPRAWRITRAQCEMLAGGVVASPATRAFLETTAPHAQTGWTWLGPRDPGGFEGLRVGVLIGVSGLDRVALAAFLRAAHARVTIAEDEGLLVAGLRDGAFDVAVTERLQGEVLAGASGWRLGWMPEPLPRFAVVFGLWKGDLTLKHAVADAWSGLQRDGTVARIAGRYGVSSRTDP